MGTWMRRVGVAGLAACLVAVGSISSSSAASSSATGASATGAVRPSPPSVRTTSALDPISGHYSGQDGGSGAHAKVVSFFFDGTSVHALKVGTTDLGRAPVNENHHFGQCRDGFCAGGGWVSNTELTGHWKLTPGSVVHHWRVRLTVPAPIAGPYHGTDSVGRTVFLRYDEATRTVKDITIGMRHLGNIALPRGSLHFRSCPSWCLSGHWDGQHLVLGTYDDGIGSDHRTDTWRARPGGSARARTAIEPGPYATRDPDHAPVAFVVAHHRVGSFVFGDHEVHGPTEINGNAFDDCHAHVCYVGHWVGSDQVVGAWRFEHHHWHHFRAFLQG